MTTKNSIVVLVTGLLTAVAAQAQGFQNFWQPWDQMTPLTAQDRELIRNTVQHEIHGKRAGTVATWTNPASGHSGTLTLLGNSTRQGMPCEQIEYRTMEPGSQQQHSHYVFTSCELPDGAWKLAD